MTQSNKSKLRELLYYIDGCTILIPERMRKEVAWAITEAKDLLDKDAQSLRDMNDVLADNCLLRKRVIELERQIEQMRTDSCTCSGCDWRETDG